LEALPQDWFIERQEWWTSPIEKILHWYIIAIFPSPFCYKLIVPQTMKFTVRLLTLHALRSFTSGHVVLVDQLSLHYLTFEVLSATQIKWILLPAQNSPSNNVSILAIPPVFDRDSLSAACP
jgi:hypothetical protein